MPVNEVPPAWEGVACLVARPRPQPCGASGEEARTAFEDDEEALLILNPEHSVGEERFVDYGPRF